MLKLYLLLFVIIIYIVFSFNNVKYGGHVSVKKLENILIVDVANMYASWRYDTGRKQSYIVCMDQHYKNFIKHNDIKTCGVVYVIKNCEYDSKNINEVCTKKISTREMGLIFNFIKKHYGASIAIAANYSKNQYEIWKTKHYMKERDDYLCFFLARLYKRAYINAVIMSNDKFRDFVELGYVPPFEAAIITKGDHSTEQIQPRMNDLGQLSDFKMANITLDFSFNGKFRKDSSFKPIKIWT